MFERTIEHEAEVEYGRRLRECICPSCGEHTDNHGRCSCFETGEEEEDSPPGSSLPIFSVGPSGLGGYCQREC